MGAKNQIAAPPRTMPPSVVSTDSVIVGSVPSAGASVAGSGGGCVTDASTPAARGLVMCDMNRPGFGRGSVWCQPAVVAGCC
jgi:hypothetical protein